MWLYAVNLMNKERDYRILKYLEEKVGDACDHVAHVWDLQQLNAKVDREGKSRMQILQEALGYVAGYGIRMFFLVQDIVQIEELYGDKQSFDSGAETRMTSKEPALFGILGPMMQRTPKDVYATV